MREEHFYKHPKREKLSNSPSIQELSKKPGPLDRYLLPNRKRKNMVLANG